MEEACQVVLIYYPPQWYDWVNVIATLCQWAMTKHHPLLSHVDILIGDTVYEYTNKGWYSFKFKDITGEVYLQPVVSYNSPEAIVNYIHVMAGCNVHLTWADAIRFFFRKHSRVCTSMMLMLIGRDYTQQVLTCDELWMELEGITKDTKSGKNFYHGG